APKEEARAEPPRSRFRNRRGPGPRVPDRRGRAASGSWRLALALGLGRSGRGLDRDGFGMVVHADAVAVLLGLLLRLLEAALELLLQTPQVLLADGPPADVHSVRSHRGVDLAEKVADRD